MRLAFALSLLLAPAQDRAGRKWDLMDYGPFLSASVRLPGGEIVPKAVVIRLSQDPPAAVCYDTDLVRCAAGWTGGFLTLMGPPFDGTKVPLAKSVPGVDGTLRFGTGAVPGWADGDGFADPRPMPYGPLPPDRARYGGLYVHGSKVVLSYTVGGIPVLELPAFRPVDGSWRFSRTFWMGPSAEPRTLLVAESPELSKASSGLPAGSSLEVSDRRILLRVAPHPEPALFRVTLGPPGESGGADSEIEDLRTLTRGGPARFREEVVTRGSPGREPGAYVVDTLTAPDRNPWNSWMRFGDLDFFPDGRALVSTWSGDLWVVSGIDEKLERLVWKRFASGLHQPLGVKVRDGAAYANGRDQITRLVDLNGDGEADFYENFNNGAWVTYNYHEYAMGLEADAEGNFYYAKGAPSLAIEKQPPIVPHHGTVLKVSRDGRALEILATGVRASNGLGVGPDGRVTCSDNDGHWGPATRINLVRPGAYYGDRLTSPRQPSPDAFEPPLCWIPKKVDNSAGGQVWVTSDRWGPLGGQLLHTSYGTCSLMQVLIDDAQAPAQGAVVPFPLRFGSGIMRARFHPGDGQLYVCGLRAWESNAAYDGILQRVRYTGRPVHTVRGMRVTSSGVDLTFTNPLDRESATEPEFWAAQRWNYLYSEKYGSPEYSVETPGKVGRDEAPVRAVRLSEDGRTVSLELGGHRPAMQLLIRFRVKAADGSRVAQEVYATVHRVPPAPK
jgi:hypothetical protein